jgi:hypothetical protein
MVYFQTKETSLGKFWWVLQRKMLVYLPKWLFANDQSICYIWWQFGMGILKSFGKFHPVLVC